jgi:hypothetical protein
MAADNRSAGGRGVEAGTTSKGMFWTALVITALPLVFMVGGSIAGLLKPELMMEGLSQLGYSLSLGQKITIIEMIFIVIYLIPRTSVLGAILLTAYLGGATASHLRVGQSPLMAIIVAMMLWGGLYLRDARLRALIPLRNS